MTEGNEEGKEEKRSATEIAAIEEKGESGREEEEDNDSKQGDDLEELEVQLDESDVLKYSRVDDLSEQHEYYPNHREQKEKEEECPFCDYMKLGPCGTSFSAWERCTETAEKDGDNLFKKCNMVTSILTACMRNNVSYYGPVLEAQKGFDTSGLQAETATKMKQSVQEELLTTEDKQVEVQDDTGLA